jgi:hypothetical protein
MVKERLRAGALAFRLFGRLGGKRRRSAAREQAGKMSKF